MTLFDDLVALGESLSDALAADEPTALTFTEMAHNALTGFMSTCQWSAEDVAAEVLQASYDAPQLDPEGRFGNPPVTVFHHDDFVVDVYFWAEQDTAVHSHAFCGAFAVMSGCSLHLQFAFQEELAVFPEVVLGSMSCSEWEVLRRGDVRHIHQGPGFIHSTVHLAEPTVSLCIRSIGLLQDPEPIRLQKSFRWPSLLYGTTNRRYRDYGNLRKRQQMLASLLRIGPSWLPDQMSALVANLGAEKLLLLLLAALENETVDPDLLQEVLRRVVPDQLHVERLIGALDSTGRRLVWERVSNEQQRLVGALLEAGFSRHEMSQVLADYNRQAGAEHDLTDTLVSLGSDGALPLDMNETALVIFRCFCEGDDTNATVKAFSEAFGEPDTSELRDGIVDSYSIIASLPLFEGYLR